MDTKLKSFIEVAKIKNFSKAAINLNLTQPAISNHIKQLEQEYDAKLFIRNNNEFELTEYGEIVLKYALRIESMYNKLERKIADSKKYKNNLSVGITHTSESNIAPEILAKYGAEMSGSHITISSDTITNLYNKLSNYEIDFAIIEGNVNNSKFSSITLGTDSLMVVISPENPLSKLKFATIDDIKKERLIVRTLESGTSTLFVNELTKLDLTLDDFNVCLEIDNVSSIKNLIRSNLGISILPKSACTRELREKTLVCLPIENMRLSRETNLVYIENNVNKNVLEDIVTIYRDMVK